MRAHGLAIPSPGVETIFEHQEADKALIRFLSYTIKGIFEVYNKLVNEFDSYGTNNGDY